MKTIPSLVAASWLLLGAQSLPAQEQAPVAVTISPSQKSYKVIDIGRLSVAQDHTPASTLEAVLNQLGADGWKVVATTGNFIILQR